MKNLTLRVDEEKLEKVRRIALERATSVNGLIREHFDHLINEDSRQAEARRELIQLCRSSEAKIGNSHWKREELYDR